MKRYRETFEFFDNEEEAKGFCESQNANATYYMRKHHPTHYTPWSSQDGQEHKFVAWYM